MWAAVEIGSAVYDGYQAYKTLSDANASNTDKATTVGLALAGAVLPSGGYTGAGKGAGAIAENLARFEKKMPSGASPTRIFDLPSGGKAFQADVPGKVPGSKATYEKQVDGSGKTLQYTKTTTDPRGNIVHVKDKISGQTITP